MIHLVLLCMADILATILLFTTWPVIGATTAGAALLVVLHILLFIVYWWASVRVGAMMQDRWHAQFDESRK